MNLLPKLFLFAALFCASSPALLANKVNSVIVPSAQVPAGQTATLTASVGYMGVQRSGQITFLVTRPNGTSSYHYANSPSGQISVVYAPNAGGVYTVKAKIDGMYQESYYNPQWYPFDSTWSPIASFSAAAGDTTAPSAPAMPTASNVEPTSFRVNWTQPNDNVGVVFYYVNVMNEDGTPRYNLTKESTASAVYSDITGLIQGTIYKVKIRARDAAQNTSQESPEMAVRTIDTEAPGAPATPTASSVTSSSFIVSWAEPSDNVGVVGYEIERLNPDGTATTSTWATPSFTVSGLAQGTTYQVRVRAKDGRLPLPNWSGWSGYRTQQTPQALSVIRSSTQPYGTSQTLGSSGGGGAGAVGYAIVGQSASGAATLSGSTLTANVATGWVDVQATKAGAGIYLSATSATARVTFQKAGQAALSVVRSSPQTHAASQTLSSSGGSGGGGVSYAIVGQSASGAATLSGSTLAANVGTGWVDVQATKAGDGNYNAATSAATRVTFQKAEQATVSLAASSSQAYGTSQTLGASGGSGSGAVSYAIVGQSASGAATLSGSTLTANAGTGWVDVQATKAADSNFNSKASSTVRVSFAKAAQPTLAVARSATQTYATSQTLSTSGGAGVGAVTYAIVGQSAGGVATLSGSTLTANAGTGWVDVQATKAGDGNYNAATSAATRVTFQKAEQSTPSIASSSSTTYGSSYTATASGGSAGAYSYALATGGTASGASVNASTGVVSFASAGTVRLQVQRLGDSNYNASPPSPAFTLTVNARSITVTRSGSKPYDGSTSASGATASITSGDLAPGDTIGYSFGAASSASAGSYAIAVTPTIANASSPTNRTSSYSITYAGSYVINKAAQSAPSITSSSSTTYGNSYTATASGGTAGAYSYALASGSTAPGASVNSSTGVVSFGGAGTVKLQAHRVGDSNYNASSPSSVFTLTVNARPITVTRSGSKAYDGTTSASGAAASITSGSLASGDTIGYSFGGTSSANAGSYAIAVTPTIANASSPTNRTSSYSITYAGSYVIVAVPNPTVISLSLLPPDVMGVGESSTLTAALSPAYSSGGQLQFFKKAPGASSFEATPFATMFINSGSTSVPFTPNAAGTWTFKIVCSGTVVVEGSSIATSSEATFAKQAVVWPAPVVSTIAPEVLRGAWTGSPTTLRAQVSPAYASAGIITFELQAPGSTAWSAVSGTIQGDRWASASWTPSVDGLWSMRAKCSGNVSAGGATRPHVSAYATLASGITVYRPNNPTDTGATMSIFINGPTPASGKVTSVGVRWSFISDGGWSLWHGTVRLSAKNPHTGAWHSVGALSGNPSEWTARSYVAAFNWAPPDAGYWILSASVDGQKHHYTGPNNEQMVMENFGYQIDQEPVFVIWQGAGQVSSICPPGDSDCDGIPDAAEIAAGLDPNDSTDSALDLDGDGYSNIFEYASGRDMTTYDQTNTALGNAVPAIWPQLVASHPTATEAVGATAGELSVGKAGEAVYTVPLWTTPGTAGMEPDLSLVYNSRAGNGVIGQGWSIGGLSSISRGPQTLAVDDNITGAALDDSDRLYLDGQRLIVANNFPYHSLDAVYRTEPETFSRITVSAVGQERSFTVYTKSGLIMEYGATFDSRQRAGQGETAVWHVSRIRDTAGNYMSFVYDTAFEQVDGVDNPPLAHHRITRINYTGHLLPNLSPNLQPYASIRFEYGASDRTDTSFAFFAGARADSKKLLKSIKVYLGETVVRAYDLNYIQDTGPLGRSLLNELVEIGADGSRYKPLTFYYSSPSPQVNFGGYDHPLPVAMSKGEQGNGTGFVDVNGDGFLDYVQAIGDNENSFTGTTWINTESGWVANAGYRLPKPIAYANGKDRGARFVDVNGDGRVDFLYGCKTTTTAYINNGQAWVSDATTAQWNIPTYIRGDYANDAEFENRYFIDANGDGRVDFVYNNPGVNKQGAYLNTGNGWTTSGAGVFIPKIPSDKTTYSIFIDVNGDGLPDQLKHQTGNNPGITVCLNSYLYGWRTLNPGDDFERYKLPHPISRGYSEYGGGVTVWGAEFADVNGDGLTDMVFHDEDRNNGNPYTVFNTGAGWAHDWAFEYDCPVPLGQSGATLGSALLDLNGDGFVDAVRKEGINSSSATNRGNRFESGGIGIHYQLDTVVGPGYGDPGSQFLDLNGDGFLDQAWSRGGASGSIIESGIRVNLTKPGNLLTGVVNAFGALAQINYSPLTVRGTARQVYARADEIKPGKANVVPPLYVVESLLHEDGTSERYKIEYSYSGMRTDPERGNLGFETVASVDARTNTRTTTKFSHDWPTIGMPVWSKTEIMDTPGQWRLLGDSVIEYEHRTKVWVPIPGQTNTFAYVTRSEERSYDPESPVIPAAPYQPDLPPATMPARLSVSTTTYGDYDAYGNPELVVSNTGDGHIKTTRSTYDNIFVNATDKWQLGRLRTSNVETKATGLPTVTRFTAFEYDDTTGLLSKEIVEPGFGTAASDPDRLCLRTVYLRDAFGNVIKATTSGNNSGPARATQTGYDSIGRFAISGTNALGHTETYVPNPFFGGLNSQTGPNGLTTSWQYDGFGRAIRETRADGTVSETRRRWAVAPAGSFLVETESTGGPPSVQFFDKLGRETVGYGLNGGTVNGLARIVGSKVEYDRFSRPVYSYLPFYYGETPKLGAVTEYDEYGRVFAVAVRDNEGTVGSAVTDAMLDQGLRWSTTTFAYDGLTATSYAPLDQRTVTRRDSQGRTVEVTTNPHSSAASEKERIVYAYDGYGQLRSTTVYNGATPHVTTLEYDRRGRKTKMIDPDMGTWTYKYNAFGELVSQIDAKGQAEGEATVTLTYDVLGRMTSRTELEGATTWVYDQSPRAGGVWIGKLTSVAGPAVALGNVTRQYKETHSYDDKGRPSSVARVLDAQKAVPVYEYTSSQTYDAKGRPSVYTYPNGFKVQNHYSEFGFLRSVKSASAPVHASDVPLGHELWRADSYDLRGSIDGYRLGNGLETDRAFDPVTGRLGKILVGSEAAPVMSHEYEYDAQSNLAVRRDVANSITESFGYDRLNRLTGRTVNGGALQSTAYDALGNILSKHGVAGAYQYGSKPHAVTQANGSTYAYDLNGNRTTGGGMTLSWTSSNQVSSIVKGGRTALFWHDPSRQRFVHYDTVDGATHYAGPDYEKTWSIDETLQQREKCYIMTPSGRVAVRARVFGGAAGPVVETRYLHQDALGSVCAVTDEAGQRERRMAYDPWGVQTESDVRPGSVESTPRGYTDHEMLDGFGLIHMNGRIYDSTLGRFCSADPFIDDAKDAQSYNRYSYVNNNPLRYVDPSGFFKFEDAVKFLMVAVITYVSYGTLTEVAGGLVGFWGTNAGVGVIAGGGSAFTGAFSASLLNGASVGDAFRTGLITGVAAAVTGGFLGKISGMELHDFERGFLHGLLHGSVAEATGGEFRHGFYSGFVAGATDASVARWVKHDVARGTAAAAIIGGTVAELGGGKFANGAAQGAFSYMFNQAASDRSGVGGVDATRGFDSVEEAGVAAAVASGEMSRDVWQATGERKEAGAEVFRYTDESGETKYGYTKVRVSRSSSRFTANFGEKYTPEGALTVGSAHSHPTNGSADADRGVFLRRKVHGFIAYKDGSYKNPTMDFNVTWSVWSGEPTVNGYLKYHDKPAYHTSKGWYKWTGR